MPASSRARMRAALSRRDRCICSPLTMIRGVSVDASGVAFDSFQQTYPAREFSFYIFGASGRRLVAPDRSGPWSVRPLGPAPTAVD